jgi:hypothetical protein
MQKTLSLVAVATGIGPLDLLSSAAGLLLTYQRAPMEIAMAPPKAHLVHHIHGRRLRVRVPARRHDAAFFEDVASKLNSLDGVRAQVTPQTGSVLIHYSGDFSNLLMKAAEIGLSQLVELELGTPVATPLIESLFGHVSTIDQQVQTKSNGQVDARTIALFGLIVAAGVQLVRGQVFGPAVPLIWYAAETVRNYYSRPNRSPRGLETQ